MIQLNFSSFFPQVVQVPGSKYHANRALLLAHYAGGKCSIKNLPQNADMEAAKKALQKEKLDHSLYASDSGTLWRFLVGLAATKDFAIQLNASEQLLKRPILPLLEAIRALGAHYILDENGVPTITGPMRGGAIELEAHLSGQFVSSLLMAAPLMPLGLDLRLKGKLSSPLYVEMTLSLMKEFGIEVEVIEVSNHWRVAPRQRYHNLSYTIPGDWSYASPWMVAAALAGKKIIFQNLKYDLHQGEVEILQVLSAFGAKVSLGEEITIEGSTLDQLRPIVWDMQNLSDVTPALSILAACVEGPSIFNNVASLRFKESNRLEVLQTELKKIGVKVEFSDDFNQMIIHGRKTPHFLSKVFDPKEDHRMMFALSLLGLIAPNETISLLDPSCVQKSNPHFWFQLHQMQVKVTLPRRHFFIVGYRGAGKTTYAKKFTQQMKVVHLDEELTKSFGCSIAEFVAKNGWSEFRDEEEKTLRNLALLETPILVDCGGGVVEREENLFWMKHSGWIIYLDVAEEVRSQRLMEDQLNSQKNRPGGLGDLQKRKLIYEKCADLILGDGGERVVQNKKDESALALFY